MPISVALSGKSYFLCANGINQGKVESDEFRKALPDLDYIHYTYVALGVNGEYYKKFFNSQTRETGAALSMNDRNWETDQDVRNVLNEGVKFISLGQDGYYFMRGSRGSRAWRLPDDINAFVEGRPEDDPVRYVWLGKDNAYVAQTGHNHRQWNLRGNYGSLDNAIHIQYNTGKISALCMNLEYDQNYFVRFSDGATLGNVSGAALTLEEFREWFRRIESEKNADTEVNIDSRENIGAKANVDSEINDDTQYIEFASDVEKWLPDRKRKYPVSENSTESRTYEKHLPKFVEALEEADTKWQSINCFGRIRKSAGGRWSIKTTVVITFSPMPDEERTARLKTTLKNIMGDIELPIEFIQGRVARFHSYHYLDSFYEPQSPLVCGASCAPKGMKWSGTIGGFVTITGDPDNGAVYAVTNHHVVKENDIDFKKSIQWPAQLRIGPRDRMFDILNGKASILPRPSVDDSIAEISLSRVIEHPSEVDRRALLRKLKNFGAVEQSEESSCRDVVASNSKNNRGCKTQQAGDKLLSKQRIEIEKHSASADRFIGATWASSGVTAWKIGDNKVEQDWALIKLYQDDGQKFANTIDNVLLPLPSQGQFRAVKPWPRALAVDVCKRGRTTNYTAGRTNGARSCLNTEAGSVIAYSAIALPHSSNPFFSRGGDSGSWLMDKAGQLVGMILSGDTTAVETGSAGPGYVYVEDILDVTYFTPAEYLFQMMQESFETAMRDQKRQLSGNCAPGKRIVLYDGPSTAYMSG
ncbi:hypothetical protein J1614_008136 [Plenodomus biglobosus]|nr:hypothetical protein J1614_008136 [Plenodomus biglobosus]